MKKLLLAGAAALVVATPAVARDNSPYVGIEGGVLFPKKQTISGNIDFTTNGTPGPLDFARAPVANVRYKMGYDLDVVGGYDFGMFRLEGELGYKRAKAKSLSVNDAFVSALKAGAGTAFTSGTNFGLDNHTTVLSAMVNAPSTSTMNNGLFPARRSRRTVSRVVVGTYFEWFSEAPAQPSTKDAPVPPPNIRIMPVRSLTASGNTSIPSRHSLAAIFRSRS